MGASCLSTGDWDFSLMKERGFSAVESLISLAVSFLVIISALQFFGLSRSLFFKLKKAEEETQAANAALDKMRIDLLHCGQGLLKPLQWGLVEGLTEDSGVITLTSRVENFFLLRDMAPGETSIPLGGAADIAKGREICLFDSLKGETKAVIACRGGEILLDSPLDHSYLKEDSQLVLLERISIFLDPGSAKIRRKVNLSSPQPLLDDVSFFEFAYEKEKNLVRLSLGLQGQEEKRYETSVFPKNVGLSLARIWQEE